MKALILLILILLAIGCNISNKNNKSFQKYDYKTNIALKELDEENYSLAIKLFKDINYLPGDTISAFYNYKIGYCYEKLNLLDSAEFYYLEALKNARVKKDLFSNDLANCYNSIAFIYFLKYSDYYTAKMYYDSVLYVSAKCRNLDSASFAWNLFNIGYFYHDKGIYQKAEIYYSEAYRIFSALKNCEEKLITVSYYQAFIYCFLEKFDIAQTKIDNAINYYLNKSKTGTLKDLYYEKAYLYFMTKDFAQSIIYYKKALQISEISHLKNSETILNCIAWGYLKLNILDSAEFYFNRCFPLITNKTDINIIVTLYGEYSRMLILKKKFNTALDIINNNLPFVKKVLGEKNSLYSYFIFRKGQALESLNRLNESLSVYQDVIKSSIDTDLKQNLFETPVFNFNDVLSNEYAIDGIKGKADVLTKLALMKENSNKKSFLLQCALNHYQKARELVEIYNKNIEFETDRLQFTSSNSNVYLLELMAATRLYCATGNNIFLEKAFLAADRNKAAQISMGLKDEDNKKLGGVPDSIIQKDKNLQEEITLLQSSIREENNPEHPGNARVNSWRTKVLYFMDESEKLVKETEIKYPRYYRLKYSGNNLNIETLKNNIGPRKTLIEYAFAGDSLYTFVLSGSRLQLISQASNGIEDKIISFRNCFSEINNPNTFTQKGINTYIKNAYQLYGVLIKPVEKYLVNKEIIIVPDGLINLLPMESLVTTDSVPAHVDYGLLKYLLYKYTISYSYSAGLFEIQQKMHVAGTNKVTAFAPIYENLKSRLKGKILEDTISELLNSREEVLKIAKIFGGKAITGKKATKSEFKIQASRGNVLHLAMHTILDNEYPMNSKLVFYQEGDSASNSFLNTYEIYNLKINSPLVVLSACNTGNGKLVKGEGIISLSRGFVYAGCPSMVSTLWNVTDVNSSRLMQLFYKNLRTNLNVDKSLQRAKIEYIENSSYTESHPYYWAGYIQTGKTESFLISSNINFKGIFIILCLCVIVAIGITLFFKRLFGNF